jgi:hypothetical protein
MATESGKDGKILIGSTPIADITRWTLAKSAHLGRYASSSSPGFKKSVSGVKSASGTIEFKWDSAAPSPITEGTAVTLKLHTNATEFFTVPAVIEEFRLEVDIDTGEVTAGTARYSSDGAWTEPTLA